VAEVERGGQFALVGSFFVPYVKVSCSSYRAKSSQKATADDAATLSEST